MAESFSRWESDPLFSAAEVVQDSADRMESVYRSLLHEQSLAQEDPSDVKLLCSLQYHKRDLKTALETTRWQLEDFEREVHFATLSDESKSREIAILKHKQFIRAIREQILQVEKSMQDSSTEDSRSQPQWMNLNEEDKDMLSSFLSGGNLGDRNSNYDTGNNMMRRFLDSNTDIDENENIEVKSKQFEVLPMRGIKNSNNVYDSSRNHMPWKIGSHGLNKHDINGPALFQGSGGQEEFEKPGANDLEFGGLGARSYSYQNRIRGSTWGFMRNFWPGNDSKGSFTKRRKDGEITDLLESEQRVSSSNTITSQDQQGRPPEWLMNAMQFFNCIELNRWRLRTSRNLISYQFTARLMRVILVILMIIGFLGFWMTWVYIFQVFIPSYP